MSEQEHELFAILQYENNFSKEIISEMKELVDVDYSLMDMIDFIIQNGEQNFYTNFTQQQWHQTCRPLGPTFNLEIIAEQMFMWMNLTM